MGQKSSKRQSYTPGGTQDAGLPTATLSENGDLRTGGANGQVRLISNRESQYGDVITSDVTSTSSPEASAEASSPAPTEKKKRKTTRFVFSLKRTGSGKRSKRGRKKEANGVRPTSYPPAPSSADQATGPRATDRDRKAQSMFVESVADELQDDVIQASLSADDVTIAEEVTINPSPAKKISTESSASSSKGHKDRKKNGSHKHKSSKKKDKEPKKKSKKKKEELDKDKKEEEEDNDDQTTAAATTAEETTAAAAAVAEALTAAAAAAAKEEGEPVKMGEMVVVSDTTTQEQEPAVETTPEDTERRTDLTQEATREDKEEETPQSSHTEEPVEETLGLTVAAVSEAEVKVSLLDDSPEDPLAEAEEEPAMTAEQLVAEIEQTILSKEHSGLLQHSFQNKLTEADQAPPEEQQESVQAKEAETSLLVPGGEENVELAGQVIHEDILELSDISSPVTDNAEQQESGQAENEEADMGTPQADSLPTDVEEEVMKQTVTAEVQSAVELVREEAVVDTDLQQQVEQLVECPPSTSAGIQINEEEAQGETEPPQHKPQQDTEMSQSTAQVPEDGMAAASAPESVADPAHQPVQDTLQPLTPAQLRALEKELKANKKKEEKERARREKEEKKRLKEEKKREAKEKKRKEKEEKERRLREAKEKAKAAANMTVEVRAEEAGSEVVEEAVRASQTRMAQSAPDTSASGDSQLQQQQQQTFVVDSQPSTSADDGGKDIQLSVGAPTDDLPVPSSSTTQDDLSTGQRKPEEQLLGSSVKEIISSIENTVDMEPKTYEESSPPEVPDTPYPEEDVMVQSSAASQFSPPAPGSPESSGPSSPVALEDSSASETTLESPSAVKAATFPLEVSETARSSVLRRIELGPRLRTAILRKSSSGAESEEKRVSLTQPRHVQVSDLTPPPRKPRPRRTLEHTRDSSGNYCYSSSSSLTPSSGKEPEPVIEEHVSVEASAPSESSPVSPQEQRGEEEEHTVTTPQAVEMQEVEEKLTTAVSSSVSQSLQLSSPSPQTADSPEEKTADCQADKVQLCEQLMENFATSGSELSEPEPSALMAVASIVHAGQKGSSDTQSARQVEAEQGAAEQNEVHTAAQSSADHSVPENRLLQEVAAQVVVRVQKVAQEKASALELEEEMALNIPDTDTQVKVTTETEDGSEKGGSGQDDVGVGVGVEGCDYRSDEDQDSDSEVGLMQATVVCSAELVIPSSRCAPAAHCQTSSDLGEWRSSASCSAELNTNPDHPERETSPGGDSRLCQGAEEHCQALLEGAVRMEEGDTASTESGTHNEVLALEKTESSTASKTESTPGDDKAEEADEHKDNPDVKNEQDSSSDTSQLQQFNKNYYDISVVVSDDDNDNDEDDDSSKVPHSTTAAADNPEWKDNHSDPSHPSPRSPSSASEEPGTHSTSSPHQKEVSQPQQSLPENGERRPGREEGQEGSGMVGVSVRCNGSHVLKAEKGEKEEEEAEDSSIDALLKLHSGVNGEKQVVLETLEHNNNVSVEVEKPATDRGETTATADTNDSRD